MDNTRLMRILLAILGFVLVALAVSLALNMRGADSPGSDSGTPTDPSDDGGLVDGDDGSDDQDIPVADDNYTASASGNIRVAEPDPNDVVSLPLVIEGDARVFESVVNYRLLDSNGTVLLESFAMAAAPDVGQFGEFAVSASYPEPSGDTGTLEVFVYSARDGSEEDKITIPVKFGDVESMSVQAFFTTDATADDCSTVSAVTRRIPKTQAVASAALAELLAGPSGTEREDGFDTSINADVDVNRIAIEDGVATVEFSTMLEAGVGGSCRVASIRSQIESTLKQFSTVQSVVILVEGKTADEVLQP